MPETPPDTAPKHEMRDINTGAIWAIGGGLAAVGVVLGFAVWGLFDAFESAAPVGRGTRNLPGERRNREPLNQRLAETPPPRLEGLDRLQGEPPWFRSSLPTAEGNAPEYHPEDLRPDRQPWLQGYGWVDRDRGVVRIPISRAMTAALEMNLLPAQPGAPEHAPKGGRP